MPIASVLGWMMVIASIIAFLNMRGGGVSGMLEASTEAVEHEKNRESAWCNLMEEMFSTRVFIFNPDFVVFTSGFNPRGENCSGLHVVDIIPSELAELFLGALSAAFRGDKVSIPCSWEGKNVSLLAHRLDGERVVLVIDGAKGSGRGGGYVS